MSDRVNCQFEVKFAQGAPDGTFEGYGSTFDEDLGGDQIVRGAFKATLAEWSSKQKLPKMMLQHGGMGWGAADDMIPIGKWTAMAEDSKGLQVAGRLISLDTDRGKSIYSAMKEGELDGLSIGYCAKEYTIGTKPTEPFRTIKALDLREVSVVLFGMNPKALISDVKSLIGRMETKDWRELEAALGDQGLSRADRLKAVSGIKKWLQRDAGEPGSGPRDEGASADLVAALQRVAERIRA